MNTTENSPETYVGRLASGEKKLFDQIQKFVLARAPGAQMVMSYGMPTFKLDDKIILHFGAFKTHLSIFPGAGPVEVLGDKLKDFKTSKGTIQFSVNRPLSDELLDNVISICVERAKS